jgi:hypothetical protein
MDLPLNNNDYSNIEREDDEIDDFIIKRRHSDDNHYNYRRRNRQRDSISGRRSSSSSDSNKGRTINQKDYISSIVGKDVQLDCKLDNLADDNDKVNSSETKVLINLN